MNHQNIAAQPSTPASSAQISEALDVLTSSMRFHPGVDPDKVMYGYMQALNGFTLEAVAAGITKFLRGECEGVNPKFCPHPPELAQIVRTVVVPNRAATPQYTAPRVTAQPIEGERDRMRLKMPMWRHAFECGQMEQLDAANLAGFGAMVVLATKWGVSVPAELLENEARTEREWRLAGNRARAAVEANPPPFMRRYHAQTGH